MLWKLRMKWWLTIRRIRKIPLQPLFTLLLLSFGIFLNTIVIWKDFFFQSGCFKCNKNQGWMKYTFSIYFLLVSLHSYGNTWHWGSLNPTENILKSNFFSPKATRLSRLFFYLDTSGILLLFRNKLEGHLWLLKKHKMHGKRLHSLSSSFWNKEVCTLSLTVVP